MSLRARPRLHFGLSTAAAVVLMSAIEACGRPASNDTAKPAYPGKPESSHPGPAPAKKTARNLDIIDIGASAFPYAGVVPDTGGTPFLQMDAKGNSFHDAPRGGRLFAAKTYSDPKSLLFIPSRFDPHAPAALVLFLHGNLANLSRDVVHRQHVPEQVEASKRNFVLVAPQLAVDALDSSAGHFWQPGFLQSYLRKAAEHLAGMSGGRFGAEEIDALPVIVVAYSGGYLSTAFSLKYAREQGHSRIAGVILLDALFGEEPKFADWLLDTHAHTFFVSAYSRSSADLNARLEREVKAANIKVLNAIPAHIGPGDVVFQPALGAAHNDFVTHAYTHDPLQDVLSRIDPARLERRAPSESDAAGRADTAPETAPLPPERPMDSACPADAPDCQTAPPHEPK